MNALTLALRDAMVLAALALLSLGAAAREVTDATGRVVAIPDTPSFLEVLSMV